MNLSDIGTIKQLLSRHGFTFSKSLGQNFLINPSVCPRMAEECGADISSGVIEIGAGIGVLTAELSKAAGKVVSLELDARLLPVLSETLSDCKNVQLINADVLKTDLHALIKEHFGDMRVSVCANLPYYITSPVIMYLLESHLPVDSITVMVQKEAAERLCAKVGSRAAGAVTVAVNYYAEAQKLFNVSAGSFLPAPKVDSTVIRLKVREKPPVEIEDEKLFFRTVKAVFAQRRKTAANSVGSGLNLPKELVVSALNEAGFEDNVRAESFTMEELARFSNAISRALQQ